VQQGQSLEKQVLAEAKQEEARLKTLKVAVTTENETVQHTLHKIQKETGVQEIEETLPLLHLLFVCCFLLCVFCGFFFFVFVCLISLLYLHK
jgi:CO dehydrogenase/acetyl-CoA synthase beta subunit